MWQIISYHNWRSRPDPILSARFRRLQWRGLGPQKISGIGLRRASSMNENDLDVILFAAASNPHNGRNYVRGLWVSDMTSGHFSYYLTIVGTYISSIQESLGHLIFSLEVCRAPCHHEGGEMRFLPCTIGRSQSFEAHALSAKCLGKTFGRWSELYPSCSCNAQLDRSFIFFFYTRRPLIAVHTCSLGKSDQCYLMHRRPCTNRPLILERTTLVLDATRMVDENGHSSR